MSARRAAVAVLVVYLGIFIFLGMVSLPPFGSFGEKHVAEYYLQSGVFHTGSANIVNAIVWDFRGYDTLGEETVLFTAAMGVFLVVRRKEYGHYRKKRV
jgi:multicomponent Na+:H+ antiporter subunit B